MKGRDWFLVGFGVLVSLWSLFLLVFVGGLFDFAVVLGVSKFFLGLVAVFCLFFLVVGFVVGFVVLKSVKGRGFVVDESKGVGVGLVPVVGSVVVGADVKRDVVVGSAGVEKVVGLGDKRLLSKDLLGGGDVFKGGEVEKVLLVNDKVASHDWFVKDGFYCFVENGVERCFDKDGSEVFIGGK